jgi:hypothetical protein
MFISTVYNRRLTKILHVLNKAAYVLMRKYYNLIFFLFLCTSTLVPLLLPSMDWGLCHFPHRGGSFKEIELSPLS